LIPQRGVTSHSPFPRDRTLRSASDLVDSGLVAPERLEALARVAERYAVALTPDLVELVADAPDGPLGRQFLPHEAELETAPEEHADPIGDDAHSPVAGIVHRYPDRVLLKAVGVCAVYCRFCFRREMVGPGRSPTLSSDELERAFAYIRAHPEIWEVILTGGDPLVLSPRRLEEIGSGLAAIGHVKIARVHTRVPVVDPGRITPELIRALDIAGKAIWLVVHVNHADELTEPVRDALARLSRAGLPLLSQSVLLRGINDDAEALAALFRTLVECRVKPYYLHQGDLAPGTGHFRTTLPEGQALMRDLRGRVSGLCQPHYVLDIPGGHGKVPVGPSYLAPNGEGVEVEDWRGLRHRYPPAPPAESRPDRAAGTHPPPAYGGEGRAAPQARTGVGGRRRENGAVEHTASPPTRLALPRASALPAASGGRVERAPATERNPTAKRRRFAPGKRP
jgi:lysine 2,3-aminomutase